MKADIVGALEQLNKSWAAFEHKGKPMTKEQVRKVFVYGIQKGYKHTGQLTDDEVDAVIGIDPYYRAVGIKSVCLCEKPNYKIDPNDNEEFCSKCGQAKRQNVFGVQI